MRVLCVANAALPESDYRLLHSQTATDIEFSFALPIRPQIVPEERFFHLPLGGGFNLTTLTALFSLALILLKARKTHDVVHFFGTQAVLAGPPMARVLGLRSMVTITGLGRSFSSSRRKLLARLYLILAGLSFRACSMVLFQNAGDLEELKKQLPRFATKFAWVGSATSPGESRSWDEFSQGPLRVLLVARLLKEKGVLEFLQLARSMRREGLEFCLVGDAATDEPDTAAAVRSAAAEGTVVYLGPLPSSDLAAIYRRSHIFCFPSRYREGMPRVMLEAGAAGLCPLAFDQPATRDLLRDLPSQLVPRDQQGALAQRLSELVSDRRTVFEIGRKFQEVVHRTFSPDAYAERASAAYRSVESCSGDCISDRSAV